MSSSPPSEIPSTVMAGSSMDRRIERSRLGRRLRACRLPVVGLLAVLGAAAAIQLVPAAGTLAVPAETVTTAIVQDTLFQDDLPVRAIVAPLRTVYVGAVEGGNVSSVAALEGSTVLRGDVLATLSNPQLQLDVSSREAAIAGQLGAMSAQSLALQQSLTAADAVLAETGYDLLKAQRELQIHLSLHHDGFESDLRLRSFAAEVQFYAERLAVLRQARARNAPLAARQQDEIQQTSASLSDNLAVVRSSLQALTLRAPVAGRLTDFALQPGQSLKQGDQIGRIDSADVWRLDADIDEFYLPRIAIGEHARATFDGLAAAVTVSRVKPQVVNGRFRAELTFDAAPPPGLRRGEAAECRITLGQTRPARVLPNGAWLDASGGSFVYVLDANEHNAKRRTVQTGRRNPEQVEVVSGLDAGERVITSSYARFADFSRLLIR